MLKCNRSKSNYFLVYLLRVFLSIFSVSFDFGHDHKYFNWTSVYRTFRGAHHNYVKKSLHCFEYLFVYSILIGLKIKRLYYEDHFVALVSYTLNSA